MKQLLLQYSGLENSTDDYIVHRVAKSQTQLNDIHVRFTNYQLSLQ